MKKPYQIGTWPRGVESAAVGCREKTSVQLVLPMIEILALAKQRAGELVPGSQLRVILLAIQHEAGALTGARREHGPDRQALRWSREGGFVVVDGQKVPIARRRLGSKTAEKSSTGRLQIVPATELRTRKSGGRCCAD